MTFHHPANGESRFRSSKSAIHCAILQLSSRPIGRNPWGQYSFFHFPRTIPAPLFPPSLFPSNLHVISRYGRMHTRWFLPKQLLPPLFSMLCLSSAFILFASLSYPIISSAARNILYITSHGSPALMVLFHFQGLPLSTCELCGYPLNFLWIFFHVKSHCRNTKQSRSTWQNKRHACPFLYQRTTCSRSFAYFVQQSFSTK